MADKYINEVGLQAIKTWADGKFTNKIETVKVNGQALTPDANKAVNVEVNDIVIQNDGALLIKNKQSLDDYEAIFQPISAGLNYAVDGLDTFIDLASVEYVDANGGKIDKIKLNGVEQTITNKEVNLQTMTTDYGEGSYGYYYTITDEDGNTFYRFETTAAGCIAGFAQGSGTSFAVTKELVDKTYVDDTFRTEAQVQQAIDDALADVTGIDFQIVDALPATGTKGVIYLLANTGSSPNTYDEYIWVTPEGGTAHYEKIGITEVDLSDYWTSASGHANSLVAMTVSEINAILNA